MNLALLKAELMHARHRRHGLPMRERVLSDVDRLGRLGCSMPAAANALLEFRPLRVVMEKLLGLSAKRTLPHYARERFDHWFARQAKGTPGSRATGKVILWDDTFVRYHEPHIGIAAVKVLEALGLEVTLPVERRCCGRPAFSQGNLDFAAELGRHNLNLLSGSAETTPIIFLEPSCYSMFAEDYRELQIPAAAAIAQRSFLFETFVHQLLSSDPSALRFKNGHSSEAPMNVAIHAHCHAKSLINPGFMKNLVERMPGRRATLLETGCCGMAGAFGALASKYDLSLQVAEPLIEKIKSQPSGTQIVASGTSCRHQIADLTDIHPKHMAEVMADGIA